MAGRCICSVALSQFKFIDERFCKKLDTSGKIISEIFINYMVHRLAKQINDKLVLEYFSSHDFVEKVWLLDDCDLSYSFDSIFYSFLTVAGHETLNLKTYSQRFLFEIGLSLLTNCIYLYLANIKDKNFINEYKAFVKDIQKALQDSQKTGELSSDFLEFTRGKYEKIVRKMKTLHPEIYKTALNPLKEQLLKALNNDLEDGYLNDTKVKERTLFLSNIFHLLAPEDYQEFCSNWLLEKDPTDENFEKRALVLKALLKGPIDPVFFFDVKDSKDRLTSEEKNKALMLAKVSRHQKSILDLLKRQLDKITPPKKVAYLKKYIDLFDEKLIEKLLKSPSPYIVETVTRPLLNSIDDSTFLDDYIEALKKEYAIAPPDVASILFYDLSLLNKKDRKIANEKLATFFYEEIKKMDNDKSFLSYKKYVAFQEFLHRWDFKKFSEYYKEDVETKPLLRLYAKDQWVLEDNNSISYHCKSDFQNIISKQFSLSLWQEITSIALPTVSTMGLQYLLSKTLFDDKKTLNILGLPLQAKTDTEKIYHLEVKIFLRALSYLLAYGLTKNFALTLVGKAVPFVRKIADVEKKQKELVKSNILYHPAPVVKMVEDNTDYICLFMLHLGLLPGLLITPEPKGLFSFTPSLLKRVLERSMPLLLTLVIYSFISKARRFEDSRPYLTKSIFYKGNKEISESHFDNDDIKKELKKRALSNESQKCEVKNKALLYATLQQMPYDTELFQRYLEVIEESKDLSELDLIFCRIPSEDPHRFEFLTKLKEKVEKAIESDNKQIFRLASIEASTFQTIIKELIVEKNNSEFNLKVKKISELDRIIALIDQEKAAIEKRRTAHTEKAARLAEEAKKLL